MASYLVTKDTKFCCGCRACEQKCPQKCISMVEKNGFFYPSIDAKRCINCKLCEKVCQYSQVNQKRLEKNSFPHVYAAWNKDAALVEKSASGGMFFTAAKMVIGNGGVVFGAKYNQEFSVEIDFAESIEECEAFRKSKYAFSNTKESYQKAAAFLEEGRQVLFSGTPCQISGLYSFLKKDYDNLLTIDLVCHGLDAPIFLQSFIQMMEEKYGSKIISIDFRHKTEGQHKPNLKIVFENGAVYNSLFEASPYGVFFGSNVFLMPSCTSCQYANTNRAGDLTIGDYWKIFETYPKAFHTEGTSLVLVNTEKGKNFFSKIQNQLEFFETDLDTALKGNPTLSYPSRKNPFSRHVLASLKKKGFQRTYKNYVYFYSKLFLIYRLFRKIKNKLFVNSK